MSRNALYVRGFFLIVVVITFLTKDAYALVQPVSGDAFYDIYEAVCVKAFGPTLRYVIGFCAALGGAIAFPLGHYKMAAGGIIAGALLALLDKIVVGMGCLI